MRMQPAYQESMFSRTYLISCGIAVALAGVAGVVIVSSYSITPTSGLSWLLIGIVVMVLAGEGEHQRHTSRWYYIGIDRVSLVFLL